MSKLTKVQKQWVKAFSTNESCSPIALLMFLEKLNIISRSEFIKTKDDIIDQVNRLEYLFYREKRKKRNKQERRAIYDHKAPKKLQSDTKYR